MTAFHYDFETIPVLSNSELAIDATTPQHHGVFINEAGQPTVRYQLQYLAAHSLTQAIDYV